MKRSVWLVLLAVGLIGGLYGCGGSSTVTVEEKANRGGVKLSPELETRFEIAEEIERRAERRGIEAETAEREGRQAEAESLYEAGSRLIQQEEKINAEIEAINARK